MKELNLIRVAYLPFGTFGQFQCANEILSTVERPWQGNQSDVSCIPQGEYLCKPKFFQHGGYPAIEITSVPNRLDILFHVANWPENVKGCIGVGEKVAVLDGKLGITNSTQSFKKLMEWANGEEFRLKISGFTYDSV